MIIFIIIILFIILLLFKTLSIEKYEVDKEPFFILWVTVEKKYENNTIYVEISDYEKGFIRGIEYTSPEPSLRRVVNEYMLPVNYSDEFNDYLGKKVAIKYYRNGKKPTDLFHVTHATLPNSKKNESSFESSKIDKDDLQPRKIRQDCIGRWNNTGTLPTKEAKYTTWKYEHVKPLEGDAKACPYENGKIIKIKYLDSPNRTKGEFLNPNINEKLISYPEYIFNMLYTPPPPSPPPPPPPPPEKTLQSFTYNGVFVGDNRVLAKVGGKWGILSKILKQGNFPIVGRTLLEGYVIESPRNNVGSTSGQLDRVSETIFKPGVAKEDGGLLFLTVGERNRNPSEEVQGWEIHRNPDNSFYVEATTGFTFKPYKKVTVKTENFMANEKGIVVIPINSGGEIWEQEHAWKDSTYRSEPSIFIESIMFKFAPP